MNKFLCTLTILILTIYTLTPSQTNSFTMKEVSKHNNRDSCWIVIDEKVYDITMVLRFHDSILRTRCGKDLTGGFATKGWTGRIHSAMANRIKLSNRIGSIKSE